MQSSKVKFYERTNTVSKNKGFPPKFFLEMGFSSLFFGSIRPATEKLFLGHLFPFPAHLLKLSLALSGRITENHSPGIQLLFQYSFPAAFNWRLSGSLTEKPIFLTLFPVLLPIFQSFSLAKNPIRRCNGEEKNEKNAFFLVLLLMSCSFHWKKRKKNDVFQYQQLKTWSIDWEKSYQET